MGVHPANCQITIDEFWSCRIDSTSQLNFQVRKTHWGGLRLLSKMSWACKSIAYHWSTCSTCVDIILRTTLSTKSIYSLPHCFWSEFCHTVHWDLQLRICRYLHQHNSWQQAFLAAWFARACFTTEFCGWCRPLRSKPQATAEPPDASLAPGPTLPLWRCHDSSSTVTLSRFLKPTPNLAWLFESTDIVNLPYSPKSASCSLCQWVRDD